MGLSGDFLAILRVYSETSIAAAGARSLSSAASARC